MVQLQQPEVHAVAMSHPEVGPERTGVYWLFRDIDNAEAERFCASLWAMGSSLSQVPGGRILVALNSGGGSVGAGFGMIEMMYKVKICTNG